MSTSTKPSPIAQMPFLVEILDSHIAYFRPGALTKTLSPNSTLRLRAFGKRDRCCDPRCSGVSESGDYEVAAEFARRFCPKGKLLFSIQKPSAKQERIFTSNQDPAFQGVVVVLTDSDSSGAAEALAGTLPQRGRHDHRNRNDRTGG